MSDQFIIYVASSSDFKKGEYKCTCSDILDKFKLEKHLEKSYNKVKIIHMTQTIPSIKKSTAYIMLKAKLEKYCMAETYKSRFVVNIQTLIEIVDFIAEYCIELDSEKKEKERRQTLRQKEQIKRIKDGEFGEERSEDEEEEDEEDLDFVATEDDSDTEYVLPVGEESDEESEEETEEEEEEN